MIEFFNKLFGRQASGATAKERLRLVLMSDHLSLAPDMIDAMKRDLVDVISKYVEVDREKIDVHFEHQDKALAMLANIPITGVSRNGGNGGNGDEQHDSTVSTDASPAMEASAATFHGEEIETPETARHANEMEAPTAIRHAEPVEARPSIVEATPLPQRRRKRRKGGQHHGGNAPQTGSAAPAT